MKKFSKVFALILFVFLLTGCGIFDSEDESWIKLPGHVVFVDIGETSYDYSDYVTCYDEDGSVITDNLVFDDSQMNYNVIGGGNVYISCTLENGTILTAVLQVGVADNIPPTIIDMIETEFTIEVNTHFSFDLYTCQDNSNDQCVIFYPTYSNRVLGAQDLVITVHDVSGNVAEYIITLNVVDTIAPTFDVLDQTIEAGEVSTLEDYFVFATDNGNELLIYSEPNTQADYDTVGVYEITVRLSDSSGNYMEKDVVVTIIDTTNPNFDTIGDQEVEIGFADIDWSTYIINATDNSDDELIFIEESDLVIYDTIGTYSVTVSLKDLSDNIVSETFTVSVVDTTAPVFDLIDTVFVSAGTDDIDWTLYIINIIENSSGDLIFNEDLDTVDYTTCGDYDVTVSVTDESGNIGSQTFTVSVVDITAPSFDLISDVIIEATEDIIDWTTYITNESDNSDDILIKEVEYNTVINDYLGVYSVTVSLSDSSGNKVEDTFEVTIVDTTNPILDGVIGITYVIGSGEIDYISHVSAYDIVDKDLTSSIIVDHSLVNTETVGDYEVEYTVMDSSGNEESIVIIVSVVE